MSYLINEGSTQDDIDTLVYVSLVMTVLSIILAIVNELSRIVDICKPKREKFTHETEIMSDFKIGSTHFHSYHAFCHEKLEHCFSTLFTLGGDWQKRSDIMYSIEVYHIDNEIKSLNTIVVYFKIKLLSVGSDYSTGK